MGEILTTARTLHRDYHAGKLSCLQLAGNRPVIEAQLQAVLHNPPVTGWPADAQRLTNRMQRHWTEWFTFLDYPEVKPDNNDAERALRPVVVHRKVSCYAAKPDKIALPLFLIFRSHLITISPSFNNLCSNFDNSSTDLNSRCAIYSFAECHTNSIKL